MNKTDKITDFLIVWLSIFFINSLLDPLLFPDEHPNVYIKAVTTLVVTLFLEMGVWLIKKYG